MNQLANFAGGAVAALSQLKTGLANVQSTLPRAGGDPILRCLKNGLWYYGQENIEVEEGSRWAVNIFSIQHGFVSWTRYKDRDKNDRRKDELVGERMVPFTQPQPNRADLPNTGWDWTEEVSVLLQCVSGEDEGTVVVYKPTSVGGINAMRGLIDKVMKQLDIDQSRPVPVVDLKSDSYQHRTYGMTTFPVIEIVDWVALDDANDTASAAQQQQDAAAQQEEAPHAEEPAVGQPVRRRGAAQQQQQQQQQQQEPAATAAASGAGDGPVRRRRSL